MSTVGYIMNTLESFIIRDIMSASGRYHDNVGKAAGKTVKFV